MFSKRQVTLIPNPVCLKSAEDLCEKDFFYYDKDGFELNQAERKFYSAMQYPTGYPILNHHCWQEPLFELENKYSNLILDHSMFLCRSNYEDEAEEQLQKLKSSIPLADFLLKTRRKWGFDFSLDAISDDKTAYEVLHVEYDNYNYETFQHQMFSFETILIKTDWQDAADKIWKSRSEWQCLKGFEQNDWKSRFLMGWSKAEFTEKTI